MQNLKANLITQVLNIFLIIRQTGFKVSILTLGLRFCSHLVSPLKIPIR
jgi:hypothetical protein